jgi:hypothetical protein
MRTLVVTFDCLPRRWLGCYGSLDSSSPGFDRLASLGVVFENAISVDVRAQPDEIAGFAIDGAVGRSGSGGGRRWRSADADRPVSRGKKRSESALSRELHEVMTWLHEQPAGRWAWLSHPGLRWKESPMVTEGSQKGLVSQLEVIDGEIDSLLDEWLERAEEDWALVVTAGRGVRLKRGTIRRKGEPSAVSLGDDLIRVPLVVMEGRGRGFGRRELKLVSTRTVNQQLSAHAADEETSLASRLASSGTGSIVVRGDDGASAVRTEEWLLVRSTEPDREAGDGWLFRKPEDVCDVFAVRSTHAEAARELDTVVAGEDATA